MPAADLGPRRDGTAGEARRCAQDLARTGRNDYAVAIKRDVGGFDLFSDAQRSGQNAVTLRLRLAFVRSIAPVFDRPCAGLPPGLLPRPGRVRYFAEGRENIRNL